MNIPHYETALKSALAAGLSRDDAHEAALQATREQAAPEPATAPAAAALGPWHSQFHAETGHWVIADDAGEIIAELHRVTYTAHRTLIAAAPALLQALQRCQECAVIVQRLADGMRNISAIHGAKFSLEANAIHAVASAAIAQAKGGAQ